MCAKRRRIEPTPTRIAVVFDFDDTLARDSTSAFLESIGVDPNDDFWPKRVQRRVKSGWDPLPAQFHALIEESRSREPGDRVTCERLREFGRSHKLYAGVEGMFERLRKHASRCNPNVELEFYVLSCGIGEIIRNTGIQRWCKRIWASEFHYGERGEVAFPRMLVSHTEKTKFLHKIAAGNLDETEKPGSLGQDSGRHVPLSQMIYVGDGFTDTPCFALLSEHEGIPIGVFKEGTRARWGSVLKSTKGRDITNLAKADYRKDSELSTSLLLAVESLCKLIELKEKIHGDFREVA